MKRTANVFKLGFILLILLTAFSAQADTYYVNKSGVDDAGRTGLNNTDQAWLTINYAIGRSEVGTGDIIEVGDGTYNEDVGIEKSITIQAENKWGAIIGDGYAFGIGKVGGVSNVTIDGLKFNSDSDNYGIMAGYDYGGLHTASNCTIKNNYVQGRYYGIVDHSTTNNCTITGNTIISAGACGMELNGTGTYTISTNTVQNCTESGIVISENFSGTATVSGNTVTGNGGAEQAGLSIQSDNVTLQGNTVQDNGDAGVAVSSGLSNININTNNQINSNDGVGVVVSGSATIEGNTINSNGNNGVYITGSATVQDNTINSNSARGIEVEDGASNVAISNNEIKYNTSDGVIVRSASNVTLTENTLTNNSENGVTLYSSATLRGNKIESNTQDGVLIEAGSPDLGQDSEAGKGRNTIQNNSSYQVRNLTREFK
ncbi:MAG: right-handed parallel beta-helix repeat-containing protein [bacterium]